MTLIGRTILIISPEAWGPNYVSKHHYAEVLADLGNKVFFLNPPSVSQNIQITDSGVCVIDFKPRFRGLARMPKWLSMYLTRLEFIRIQNVAKVRFDLLWNFDSSRFFNLTKIPSNVLKICHIVDLNQNIQRGLLANTSDICFGTTRYILEELKKHNRNSHLLGHAYRPREEIQKTDFKMPGSNLQKALYVGNLSMKYIDWKILLEAANDNKQIDFVFVGPDGASNLSRDILDNKYREKLKGLENAFFLAQVHASEVPLVLKQADFLIIAYQEHYHKDQAAPHKMLEYLASGKTVVATYTEDFDDDGWRPQLRMCRANEDFSKLFEDDVSAYEMTKKIPTYVENINWVSHFI